MITNYQICSQCIMDTSDPEIQFDAQGICNHCYSFEEKINKIKQTDAEKKLILQSLIQKIKQDGKNKEYDCIAGISGGVDSTYVLYKLKEMGLRPLVIHLDNGWNSELAVHNIENVIKKLNLDLYTNVLNWQEFKQLQIAYLYASVLDLEALSDHSIFATLYREASKRNIKYIITGSNLATEGILPSSWRYENKLTDVINIKSIYRKFAHQKLKNFPLMSIQKFIWYKYVKKIQTVDILNYLDFNKEEAKQIIQEKLGWRDYGGKHHESIITRFYQGYILPQKFGIDKRRAHLSTLILSKQLSRSEALLEMEKPIYAPSKLKEDLQYVPKKLGLSPEEFEKIMLLQPKSHDDYPTDKKWRLFFSKIKKLMRLK